MHHKFPPLGQAEPRHARLELHWNAGRNAKSASDTYPEVRTALVAEAYAGRRVGWGSIGQRSRSRHDRDNCQVARPIACLMQWADL